MFIEIYFRVVRVSLCVRAGSNRSRVDFTIHYDKGQAKEDCCPDVNIRVWVCIHSTPLSVGVDFLYDLVVLYLTTHW